MRFRFFPVTDLPVGLTLGCTIYDDRRTKLLSAGVRITQPLIEGLLRRNVHSVVVSMSDIGRMLAYRHQGSAKYALPEHPIPAEIFATGHSHLLDTKLTELLQAAAVKDGPEFIAQVRHHGTNPYDAELMSELADGHESRVAAIDEMCQNVDNWDGEEVHVFRQSTDDVLKAAAEDLDLFVNLGGAPSGGNYPGRHSQHTAMLAMAVGATLGLDADQLRQLGLGCLIHDLGMLTINPSVLRVQRYLSDGEFTQIARHPIRTFDVLEKNLDAIPAGARMVAYQMHERYDGTGYPRQRKGTQIHLLARIAAIADTYVALVAPRPHRSGMLPYSAVTKIIKDAGAGKYDPTVVRAFLKTISLFPIGSFVELSDDRVGRVLRVNPASYDRPILEIWKKGQAGSKAAIIDLAHEPTIQVLRPLAAIS